MPKLTQVSFTSGEIDPALAMRNDLARYATALKTCRNFFVRPTGGVSNRAGFEFVAALWPESSAVLIPFIFSTEQTYMLVLQEELIQVYSNGGFVAGTAIPLVISGVTLSYGGATHTRTIETTLPHGLSVGQQITISGVVATDYYNVNGNWVVLTTPSADTFTIKDASDLTGSYTSGGTVTFSEPITTDYQSDDLAAIRYTQSADVVTLVHAEYAPSEFIRTAAAEFTFGVIPDIEDGPFLDFNTTDTTLTADAATGTGITITASTPVFVAEHVSAFLRLDLEDISGIAPWEASKLIAASGGNPIGLLRRSLGKVYRCATNEVAGSDGTYTGTVRPSHDEGTETDGDGNAIANLATRAGVAWEYLHSLYGIVQITAVAGDGLSATANVIKYVPVVSPAVTTVWAFGAWSPEQGYPSVVTYYSDRQVFANTPGQPQSRWASKVSEYHNFGESAPVVDDDAITETLNARQANAIVEMVPLDQLISLTSSGSWASPQRGETWTPNTIGFFPQSHKGAASMRALLVGDAGALFVMRGATKIAEIRYGLEADKFGGDEITVLSRHLFSKGLTIVDWDWAEEPHGIVWIVRSDGALIGVTYLPEQQVIGWHKHDTDGFFERVCVIPEGGRDVVYVVVRRTINGETVRFLERMANREVAEQVDGFFVDCGSTYDGRNESETTITITGASYDGGDEVTLTASASTFDSDDVGDAIMFGTVMVTITSYTSATEVVGHLETPVPADLQDVATTEWSFARDTFEGLNHLEGATVAICADGASLERQVVTDGTVTLPHPASVVHIGLPYTSEIETLDVTIFGAESIRDRSKVIPEASVVVQDTVGLRVGTSGDYLEHLSHRSEEYYTEPTEQQSGVASAHVIDTYNENGRLLLRQEDPLPATILAIIPKVELGE